MSVELFEDILNDILETSDDDILSSSSSENESILLGICREREEHEKLNSFVEIIQNYSDEAFRQHFRLSRKSVTLLVDLYAISDVVPKKNDGGRQRVGAHKEILLYLWYVGNTVTFRQLATLFGTSQSAAWTIVRRVSLWFVENAKNYVKWPSRQGVASASAAFKNIAGIPAVLGAIDGTHIKIKAPKDNAELYFNRKKYHSLVVQAVVSANKKFIDVYCGEPGTLHDSRVLRKSTFMREVEKNPGAVFPNECYLLGDSAYPQLPWLITPFKDYGQLTQQQKKFNTKHSSTRIVVENAFGLLKTRFRRLLHFTEVIDLNFCVNIILSCCVLHNICMDEGSDELEIEYDCFDSHISEDDEEPTISNEVPNTQTPRIANKRQELFNCLTE